MLADEFESALEKFREIVKVDTEYINAYLRLAELFRLTNRPKQALKIHQSLTIRTNLTEFQQVQIYRGLMKDWEVLENYERALKIADKLDGFHKDNIWTLDARMRICKKQNDWKSAYKILSQILKIKNQPNDSLRALYLMQYGRVLVEKGQLAEARKEFEHASQINQTIAAPHLYAGDSFHRENNREKAIEEWTDFAVKNPENAFLVFDKVEKAFFEMGKFSQIAEFYQSILRADPDNVEATAGLADYFEKKGDTQSALDLVEKTLELDPSSIRTRLLYAKLLNKIGEKPAVNQQIENALNFIGRSQAFVCSDCQFQSDDMLWLCPQCSEEDSFHIQSR